MTRFVARTFLDDLNQRNLRTISDFKAISDLSPGQWNWKLEADSWSMAQILEHLLITNNHYIDPLIETIQAARKRPVEVFRSGWVGDFIVSRIEPGSKKGQKAVKAPRFLEPQKSQLDGQVLADRFLIQLNQLDKIIVRSREIDISSIKIPLSFTKLLKLNIGDVLRLIIAHNDRHLLQMQRLKDKVIFHSKVP